MPMPTMLSRPLILIEGKLEPGLGSDLIHLEINHATGSSRASARFGNWGPGPDGQIGYRYCASTLLSLRRELTIQLDVAGLRQSVFLGRIIGFGARYPGTGAPSFVVEVEQEGSGGPAGP